ncbi:AraC family transcriptional regulator [Pseudomonas mosselii]|uniref:helix-turn-helix transcriptional regulator n=1 Tax=Pseudomonas TaxID=286 RepID=UPI000B587AF2|nr:MULTISPECIES: AraC family transcriptional regulator [Pseudomonas]MBH3310711.1 helix-turn-helix domain-containing protein [Pseudomonas mosselii]MBH3326203.1 helix-turn-helix domain-containing protein [Pseudomonas mosselii]MCL8298771.1 AraC family transcriptional regulator [Pseudomonas mosselii]MCL8338757.1 AraC family transcriptional regulator [Pseudomonas mosselii]MDH1512645.1 AraC family transcriptional regulator [Pseudomonas mosselii]
MTAAPLLSLRHYRHDLIAHSHDHSQLVFGLGGRLDFEVDGRGGRVGRQDLMVVPAGAHHTCGSPEGSHCLVLDVPGGHWLGEHLGEHADNSRRLLDRPGPLGLDSRQQQLVDWLAASPVDDPLIARQGAVLLLASLNPQVGAPVLASRRLPYAAFDRHIEQHAAYPLQVADLARLAGLSSARLHARFASERGMTPMDYIRERRLAMARRLLRETLLPVGEVSARVGYGSQSAFSAAVMRAFGCTPLALRRESGDNGREVGDRRR